MDPDSPPVKKAQRAGTTYEKKVQTITDGSLGSPHIHKAIPFVEQVGSVASHPKHKEFLQRFVGFLNGASQADVNDVLPHFRVKIIKNRQRGEAVDMGGDGDSDEETLKQALVFLGYNPLTSNTVAGVTGAVLAGALRTAITATIIKDLKGATKTGPAPAAYLERANQGDLRKLQQN